MIKIRNLTKTYHTGKLSVEVLKGLNLDIDNGEYVSIMGPSGSGKSTFLNILGCLDLLSTGEYILDNKNIDNLSDDELSEIRCEKIGFVFQSYNLLSKLTALENVELPAMYLGTKKDVRRKHALELLDLVGLSDRINHKPNEMSGGQKQRVAIARSMINNPKILLADEPTGNLDSKSTEEILQIFKKLNDSGVTIIMVTHEEDVAEHTKRIVRLKDGIINSDMPVIERRGV
ncbi:ABC transporter ATP-binding protein [Sneathia sanguinegens]|uniref:ABC transporter ATP-binding protein n=1 Tax=Sneathia sanguinegens TaxID=40543 RepID=A0ABT7HKI9_9FUSO|nr:ABC transporter ATP-binding protein [Sneathia sanguinegens]MDK9581044.1 ABC transporter ATP-binding protein [Sneathia sanguinegens]MDU4651927.1 ABC transporter ATP-binding protein [Sneathia sanguinegens]